MPASTNTPHQRTHTLIHTFLYRHSTAGNKYIYGNTFCDKYLYIHACYNTSYNTNTPVPAPTESDKLEIKDRLVYPCPWNTDGGQNLKIRFTATKRFTSARIFIYTVNFRQIRMLETQGGPAGQNTIELPPVYLSNLANGSYYYLITAKDISGKEARAKVDKILILK